MSLHVSSQRQYSSTPVTMSVLRFIVLSLICSLVGSAWGYIETPGPRYPATRGRVWPEPQMQNYTNTLLSLTIGEFEIQVVGDHACTVLTDAIDRYYIILAKQARKEEKLNDTANKVDEGEEKNLKKRDENEKEPNKFLTVERLQIMMTKPCEQWPSSEMDEEYSLEVHPGTSVLTARSLWGALRGLETFSQLAYKDFNSSEDLLLNSTSIRDFPRFSHRGLLLDTSRHFINMDRIKSVLDGMVYNKLNVFHWHIVDDHSFPYVSRKFPSLSQHGAYHPQFVYTQEMVAEVIEYARSRGIRVMPEFDTPGHTRSWGVAYPELLTQCCNADGKPNGDLGPMDPTVDFTYSFMEDLMEEVVDVFQDRYIHLGGDEVDFDCWESNPNITDFMEKNDIKTYYELEELYIQKIVDLVSKLEASSVVWQEVYINGVKLPNGTVVQVWTGDRKALLSKITNDGLPALMSACWYLDHLNNGGDWEKYYACDPHDFPGNEQQKRLVLGGEACMWAEVVDNNNVLTRIFPRVAAPAEKLWSAQNINVADLKNRMEEHYCRLNVRGIPAQPPSAPGFCPP